MHRLYANSTPSSMSLEHPWILVSAAATGNNPCRYQRMTVINLTCTGPELNRIICQIFNMPEAINDSQENNRLTKSFKRKT